MTGSFFVRDLSLTCLRSACDLLVMRLLCVALTLTVLKIRFGRKQYWFYPQTMHCLSRALSTDEF